MKKTVRTIEITFANSQKISKKIVRAAETYGERIVDEMETLDQRSSTPDDEMNAHSVSQFDGDENGTFGSK